MGRSRLALAALALFVTTTATACSRNRPVRQQAAPDDSVPAAIDRPASDPGRSGATNRDDSAERAPDPGGGPGWAALETRIYFDYDRSDLSAEARGALAAKLAVLLANPDIRIQVVGHADERGSDEYNLALGLERAAAAKRYLTQRGVDAGRISAISMGEERPVCTDSGESCWWRNRRDEFLITSVARPRRP
jgi:peptidoglycan-associated lipoprotein